MLKEFILKEEDLEKLPSKVSIWEIVSVSNAGLKKGLWRVTFGISELINSNEQSTTLEETEKKLQKVTLKEFLEDEPRRS